jgi:hypothetical protein
MSGVESAVADPWVRILAFSAGTITAVTVSFGFGLVFAVICVPLVLGSIIQRFSTLIGRVFMWVGALLVSFIALPLGIATIRSYGLLMRYHDLDLVLMWSGCVASFLLALGCNVALIADAAKQRRASANEVDSLS